MTEENYCRLDVKLIAKTKKGTTVEVLTNCGSWELMQKFLNDFEDTLLKGYNGKT